DTTPLSADMSAYEMLQVGIENYYNADVAVSAYNGNVATKLLGLEVFQLVESTKIREGKGDAEGENANNATYFADNKSFSRFAKLYEKMVIKPGENIRYKTAKEGIDHNDKTGEWSVKTWKDVEYYQEVLDLADAKNNNPTVLWMYDLQEDYVLADETETPVLKDGVYSFTIKFDPIKSTANYIDTMKAQLEGNANMPVDGLTFEELNLNVELGDNGAIKRIFITESYFMKMKVPILGYINSSITLNSDTQYAYKQVDGLKLQEHIDAF
ncbi:MAG: hypothetical protein K2N32_05755, partial [Clostridia bacterium]|nr:hypothetical protein [Clostridia bacterium]